MSNTYTQFNGPGERTYAGLTWTMGPIQSPAESLHERGFRHHYAVRFEVAGNTGYTGLQIDGAYYRERIGPTVSFSIWNVVGFDSVPGAARRELVNRESGAARIICRSSGRTARSTDSPSPPLRTRAATRGDSP